jgi:hypothetical protein
MKLGMAIAARMPMMATTIMSSMRVKPLVSFFICFLQCESTGRRGPPGDEKPG